jgi:iron complex transport system substrate-binding protein
VGGTFLLIQHAKKPNLISYPLAGLLLVLLPLLLSSACRDATGPKPAAGMTREVIDEAGRRVTVPVRVERIISLAPNLTEIVYALGVGDRLVGDTEYCNYPAEAAAVAKVGDTLHPSAERILALRPQLVLVSTASQLESFTKELGEHQIAVFVTDPHDLAGVFQSIQNLGSLLGATVRATELVANLQSRTLAVEKAVKATKPVRVFYQLSDHPLYTAGHDSFTTDLIHRAGGVSVTADVPGAWPRYSDESALASQPEAIILPSGGSMSNVEPADPLKKSPAALAGRVYKISEDHLNRPGPRLVDGLEELARVLHPESFKQ